MLFPKTCPLCGRVIEDKGHSGECFCKNCLRQLPRTEQAVLRGNITEELFVRNSRFQRGAAFLFYEHEHPIRKAIHTMKFHSRPDIAYHLAREAAYDFMQSDFFEDIDLIIPIPLHPKRLRERGYNQSEWIARALSEITGIPMDADHLTRIRNTRQQALQTIKKRKTNVEGAFAVLHPEELYRKHILIVDDLITTGATILACMDAMNVCRGAKFSVFALGKAR